MSPGFCQLQTERYRQHTIGCIWLDAAWQGSGVEREKQWTDDRFLWNTSSGTVGIALRKHGTHNLLRPAAKITFESGQDSILKLKSSAIRELWVTLLNAKLRSKKSTTTPFLSSYDLCQQSIQRQRAC